jgi:hypothetical protein
MKLASPEFIVSSALCCDRGVRITFKDMCPALETYGSAEADARQDLLGSFDVLIIDYNRHKRQIRLHDSEVLSTA